MPESIDDVVGLSLCHVTVFDRTLHPQMTRDILPQTLTYRKRFNDFSLTTYAEREKKIVTISRAQDFLKTIFHHPFVYTLKHIIFSDLRDINPSNLCQKNIHLSIAGPSLRESSPSLTPSLDVGRTAVPVWSRSGAALHLAQLIGERVTLSQGVLVERLESAVCGCMDSRERIPQKENITAKNLLLYTSTTTTLMKLPFQQCSMT